MDTDVELIDPFSLPSVGYRQRSQLPKASGIYFAIVNEELLYIGQSYNLYYRWQYHERRYDLKALGDITIAWFTTIDKSENERWKLEEAYIDHFRPALNRTLKHTEEREQTMLYINTKSKFKLKHLCVDKGMKLSDIVNEAIDQYIELLDGTNSLEINMQDIIDLIDKQKKREAKRKTRQNSEEMSVSTLGIPQQLQLPFDE